MAYKRFLNAVLFRVFHLWFFAALAVLLPGVAPSCLAAPETPAEIASKKEDLEALRARLDALKRELSAREESKNDALDQLRQSEEEISRLERTLFALRKNRSRLQKELEALNRRAKELEQTLSGQRAQLERLLYRQYTRRGPEDPLLFALNGEDPNVLARDLYYLSMIARAQNTLLVGMRAALEEQRQLAAEVQAQAQALADVEARQERERAALLREKKARQTTFNRIAGQIRARRREIGVLEQNERRLSTLVARLTTLLGKSPGTAPPPVRAIIRSRPSEAPTSQTPKLPPVTPGNFARLKGLLRLPAPGQIVGRFGEKRDEGNAAWKGLYIRAPEGSEVRAVANGQVVYAEWMRGFGNLLIIDHGSGYLTVYGNNHALLKEVGEQVLGGETVGIVGNSGGEQDSGLYFELRHQGQVLDPMKWISLK
ncbi:MAG: peptidoglycan DD-metalloendopeptidase family protein [Zoogloeaceae bacterium]|jgi:septal ring factor EnvC (AmiA/AmiB activator)|nr:peptidoglycan DD-metalloendopeptidase family protein [Zoogloeaceae bacterium]